MRGGMIPPTNPKKRSLMPSGKLRHSLRGYGHALSAIVQVGKAGVTQPLIHQLTGALDLHELVKVKVGSESPLDRFAVAERLAREPGVDVVQIVGRTVLLYKRHPQEPRYEGKRAAATEEKARAAAGLVGLSSELPARTSKRTPPGTVPETSGRRPPRKVPAEKPARSAKPAIAKPGIIKRMAAKRAALAAKRER